MSRTLYSYACIADFSAQVIRFHGRLFTVTQFKELKGASHISSSHRRALDQSNEK